MLSTLSKPKSLWSYNPIPRGCVAYAPLWHPDCHGPVFQSLDPLHHTCTRTGGVMDGVDGFTADGDDYISLTSLWAAGTAFTAVVWFMQSVRQDSRIFMFNTTGAATQGMGFGIDAPGADRLRVVYDGVAWGNGVTVPALNTKYMATMIRNANLSDLYLNDGAVAISTLNNVPQDGGADIILGRGHDGAAAAYYLKGAIIEWWLYDRALSAAEWAHIHSKTVGRNQ